MKKYFLYTVCFLVITNFIFLACSSDNNPSEDTIVVPTVTTAATPLANQVTATSGGSVTSDGGSPVTSRGVCWSTTATPTITNHKTTDGNGVGDFVSSLTELTANTLYYVRAYATNSAGTGYGAQVSFTTTNTAIALPVLTTTAASDITPTSATSGGNVTSVGGADITARGICWATTANPTTANSTLPATGTTGTFTSPLTGLTANTVYYVRAYATNSGGTAYGTQITFTTGAAIALPVLTTTAATLITQTTASSGGNVTSTGGSAVTARGICWATTANPTIANSTIPATGTTGTFTSSLAGLNANTTYYVRAYATNTGGTAYGTQITFTTLTSSTTGGPTGGNAICNGTQPTTVVPITSSTGKIWMDRNLGASRAATSLKDFQAYGCLYQWGRGNDGHASITWTLGEEDAWGTPAGTAVNGSTYTLSNSDTPPDALFIKDQTSMPYDWRSPKNDNLWQGVDGINNPCPAGYRVPTRVEFKAEITAYSITGPTSAYNSILKLPTAGDRAFDSGMVRGQGQDIFYWTSTVDSGDAYNVLIQSGAVYTNVSNGRAGGYSVRCIKN